MPGQGTTTVNFGAFPGSSDTSVTVTGQSGISGSSLVEAWIIPTATADHTADEHLHETIAVSAGNIVAGVGFTIYAWNTSQLSEPMVRVSVLPNTGDPSFGGLGTRLYGQFTVAWVWN